MSRTLSRASIDICADCSALDPSWVSVNRGVLICDGCCSVHLSLGRHVSQIKSLKKGSWSPQQLTMVHQLVNCGANNIWEYSLLDPSQNRQARRKPNPRDQVYPIKADFIRAKYQFLAFVNKHKDNEVTLDDLNRQLHASVRTSNLETSLRLLSTGADPNFIHPEKGTSPLHVATQACQASQIELLLVYGADPGSLDTHGRTAADIARTDGHNDLCDRLVECQYELTDGLAFYLCNRRPDHRIGQHFIIPEMADSSLDLSELAKAAKKKLHALSNHLFEELAMDVYDEVDRRENETIWLSTQNHGSMLVSDRQTVPFLPANPEYSATRNQGRQKLAKFNKREFATLIIDILNDAKRRYGINTMSPTGNTVTALPRDKRSSEREERQPQQRGGAASVGGVSGVGGANEPRDVKLLRQALMGCGGGVQAGNIDDDEPLYDSVCSDEDYASIGETHSIKEETGNLTPTPTPVGGAGGGARHSNIDSATVTKQSVGGNVAITVNEYVELRRTLEDSQSKMQLLLQSNLTLGDEVAALQNMVKKLVYENKMLRCGFGGKDTTCSEPADSSINRPTDGAGHGKPVEHGKPARWSMVESTDPRLRFATKSPLLDFPSPPEELLAAVATDETKTSESTEHSNASTVRIQEDTPQDVSPTDVSASVTQQQPPLPAAVESSGPLGGTTRPASSGSSSTTGSCTGVQSTCLPTQDDVVKKTEKITRRLQELFHVAQNGNRDSFPECAEKIHVAVAEMSSLFPQSTLSGALSEAVVQLCTGADNLREQCLLAVDCQLFVAGSVQYRQQTQRIIQSAYDIAKAAKQLVVLSE